MIHKFLKLTKFIPNEFHESVYDIDFEALKEQGIQCVLSDLDNTLISYDEALPTKENLALFDKLKDLGMELALVSNNVPARLETYTKELTIKGYANARKPLNIGLKRALKNMEQTYNKDQIVVIGDQLLTDVWGANRLKAYSILVNPIKRKTEKWYTKMNRKTEEKLLQRMALELPKTYQDLNLDKRS
jgi:HAD superfamily phosphatase (TIGR01668 family)